MSALGRDRGDLLFATGDGSVHVDRDAAPVTLTRVDGDVTTITRLDGMLILGYADGRIQLAADDERKPGPDVQDTPPSAVTRIIASPAGTIAAGFGDGTAGLWDMGTGERLIDTKLFGPIRHLLLEDDRLIIATDQGDHDTLDVRVFEQERCEILREVWDDIPIVSRGGRLVFEPRPERHPCLDRGL